MLTMLARWQMLRIDQSDILTIRRFAPMSHTHNTTRLTALYPALPGWAGTRKVKPIWILLKQETVSGSGISWAIWKSAPRSSQITTPAPHCSVFTGRMPFLPPNQQCQSTEGNVSAAKNFRPILHISVKVQAFHHMYHFIGLPKMIFVFSMLQRSVPYLSDFPPYGRNSWTLWHRCRNVQAQGPKCPGLWSELSQHWDRNFSVPKCLDAKVSSGTGAELSWVRCVR